MKRFFKTVLAVYTAFLLWLILFKFSADPLGVLSHHDSRSLNLIPFVDAMNDGLQQMIDNVLVFVPLGLLISVNFKEASLLRKFMSMLSLSLLLEGVQYIFAIGTTDITDVITNAEGGLFAIMLYDALRRHVSGKVLDWCITVIVAVLLLVFMLLRIFMFRVMY